VDIFAWSSAVVAAVVAVKLVGAVRRANRRINDMIENADQIIADSAEKGHQGTRRLADPSRLATRAPNRAATND
jgi:hypothetical protein